MPKKKRMTYEELIEERHRVTEKLRKAMVEADMDMKDYSDLNDYYHWLDDRIRKKGKKK